jgi:tetratricopeptide (TPR) repeat protein
VMFAAATALVVVSAVVSAYLARAPSYSTQASTTPQPPIRRPFDDPPPPIETPPPAPPVSTVPPTPTPVPVAAAAVPRIEPSSPARSAARRREESARREEGIRREEAAPAEDEQRDPTESRLAAQRGRSAQEAGRIEEAKAEFERAIEADGRNPSALCGMAEVQFERAKYDEAFHYATRGTRAGPRVARCFSVLGDAGYRLGRYADAIKAYKKCKALDPAYPQIDARIQKAAAQMGQPVH